MKRRRAWRAVGWLESLKVVRRRNIARQSARVARIEALEDRTLLAGSAYQLGDTWDVPGVPRGSGIFDPNGGPFEFSYSYSVALGDFDRDDDLDAFVANGNGFADQVFLNDGAGNLAINGQLLRQSGSAVVDVGDVDGDLDLDALVAAGGGPLLRLNDSSGQFTESEQDWGGTECIDLALRDLDGDDDLDVFAATIGGDSLVWLNDGVGNFTRHQTIAGPPDKINSSLTLSDFDGDKDLDALVTGIIDETPDNTLHINDGSGGFTSRKSVPQDQAPLDVLSGDIDGDDDADAVAITVTGAKLWINDGTGTLAKGDDLPAPAWFGIPWRGSLGDLDSDDDLDLLVTVNSGSDDDLSGTQIFLNPGNGLFFDSGQNFGAKGTSFLAGDFGDLDGDRDIDIFLAGIGQHAVLANGGGGSAFAWLTEPSDALDLDPVELADLDADGDLDAFQVDDVSRVLLNDGDGALFASEQRIFTEDSLGSPESVAVALGDLDGDFDLDAWIVNAGLVTSEHDPADSVWINDGSGVFTDSGQRLGTDFGSSVEFADLDGDEDLDAFVGNIGFNRVWFNDGSGVFTRSEQDFGDRCTNDVALGDLDGDEDVDVFVAKGCDGDKRNKVWLNDGFGKFTPTSQNVGLSTSHAVALADMDGDGDLDAVVANRGPNETSSVWLNDGDARFFLLESGFPDEDWRGYRVALGDLDDDGDVDVAFSVSAYWGGASFILMNDGAGHLADHSLCALPIYATGDLDRDGDTDGIGQGMFNDVITWLNGDDDFGQRDPAVATAPDGRFVIAWESDGGDKDDSAIFAQLHTTDGTALASPILVNADARFRQEEPAVAIDDNGNFTVAWTSANLDGDGDGIFARRFDASGAATSPEVLVNFGGIVGHQYFPDIATDSFGNVVIAWADRHPDGDRTMAQLYRADGTPVGLNFPVNTTHPGIPKVAYGRDGGLTVAWEGELTDRAGYGIYLQRFAADGSAIGTEQLVSVSSADRPLSVDVVDLAYNENGDLLVTWFADNLGAGSREIYGRLFDSQHDAKTDVFIVNTTTSGEQNDPRVVALPSDAFLVTWREEKDTQERIVAQRIDRLGNRSGGEVEVQTADQLFRPSTAADAQGEVTIVWQYDGESLADGTNKPELEARTLITSTVSAVLDVTGSENPNPFQDGILIVRFMLGQPDDNFEDPALIPAEATRTTAAEIRAHLVAAGNALDANGDGTVNPFQDGILIVRFLLGQPDTNLEDPALIPAGSTRATGAAIRAYLNTLMPPGTQRTVVVGGEGESIVRTLIHPADVNGDGAVTVRDALNVIHGIQRGESIDDLSWTRLDANQDDRVTAADALHVINRLAENATPQLAMYDDADDDDQLAAVDQLLADDSFVNGLI